MTTRATAPVDKKDIVEVWCVRCTPHAWIPVARWPEHLAAHRRDEQDLTPQGGKRRTEVASEATRPATENAHGTATPVHQPNR